MDDLEQALRKAVRNGLLTISLAKLWEGDKWEATFRNTDNGRIRRELDPDPVEALLKALRRGATDATVKATSPRKRDDDLI